MAKLKLTIVSGPLAVAVACPHPQCKHVCRVIKAGRGRSWKGAGWWYRNEVTRMIRAHQEAVHGYQ